MARRMSKAKKRLVGGIAAAVLVVGIAVAFSCIPHPPDGTRTPERVTVREAFRQVAARPVRVLLVSKQATATVGTTASYSILSADGSRTLAQAEGESLPESIVRSAPGGLEVGGTALPHAVLRIRPVRDGAATVNGRRYRGELLVRRESDGAVSVINLLPLDSYLYSVLGSETYASWPDASHDAQAIVARTYTLWRMIDRNDKHFDVHGSVQDQSYEGVAKEAPRLRAAVDRTAGVVLLYQAKLFRAYYHSTCGGQTEAVEDYFPDAPLLPLSGVRCDHCQASKHYRWRRDIVKADVAKALRADGVPLHQVPSRCCRGPSRAVPTWSRSKTARAGGTVSRRPGSASPSVRRPCRAHGSRSTTVAQASSSAVVAGATAWACASGAPGGWPRRATGPRISCGTTTLARRWSGSTTARRRESQAWDDWVDG